MAISKIQVVRGLKADLPTLRVGEPAFCTDTKEFFVGTEDGNELINQSFASQQDHVSVTVGPTGDYSKINEAIDHLQKNYYPVYQVITDKDTYEFPEGTLRAGFHADIVLQDDFVVEEQVLVTGVDLSWITIVSESGMTFYDPESIEAGTQIGDDTQQTVMMTVPDFDDDVANLDGQYIQIFQPDGTTHYFYIGTDPSITGATGHEITLDTQESRISVAQKFSEAIRAVDGWQAYAESEKVRIVNDEVGDADDAITNIDETAHTDSDSTERSYRDIFEGMNIYPHPLQDTDDDGVFDGGYISGSVGYYDFIDGYQYLDTRYNNRVLQLGDGYDGISLNDTLYLSIHAKKYEDKASRFVWGFGKENDVTINLVDDIPITLDFATYSFMHTIDTEANDYRPALSGFSGTHSNAVFKDVFTINLSRFDTAPTQSEMDTMRDSYLKGIKTETFTDNQYRTRFVLGVDHGIATGEHIIVRDQVGEVEEDDYNGYHEVVAQGDSGAGTEWIEIDLPFYDYKVTDDYGTVSPANPIEINGDWLIQNGIPDWEFFYQPTFGVARGTLPTIGALFKSVYDQEVPDYGQYLDGFCATDGGVMNFLQYAGIIGSGGSGIYGTRSSRINANDAFAIECGRHGFWAYANTVINARRAYAFGNGFNAKRENLDRIDEETFIDELTGCGVIATRGSQINAESATITNNYSDNVHSEHGASIVASFAEVFGSEVGKDYGYRYGGVITTEDGNIETEKHYEDTHAHKMFDEAMKDNVKYGFVQTPDGKLHFEKYVTLDSVAFVEDDGTKHTYKEMFEGSEVDYSSFNPTRFLEVETGDNYIIMESDGDVGNAHAQFDKVFPYRKGDRVYTAVYVEVLENADNVKDNVFTRPIDDYLSNNGGGFKSKIGVIGEEQTRIFHYTEEDGYFKVKVSNYYNVDLEKLDNEPTKEKMDELFETFLTIKEQGYKIIETITLAQEVE